MHAVAGTEGSSRSRGARGMMPASNLSSDANGQVGRPGSVRLRYGYHTTGPLRSTPGQLAAGVHALWDGGQCLPEESLQLQPVVVLPGDSVCSFSLPHPGLVLEQASARARSSVLAASDPLALAA